MDACPALTRTHLGEGSDIHGGGIDLRFPHHENEIAQGTEARFWLRNGHVTASGAKMSKVFGDVLRVRDLLAEIPGEAVRYALLSARYRQPLDWTPDTPRPAPRLPRRARGRARWWSAKYESSVGALRDVIAGEGLRARRVGSREPV
ncbi:hypothetical protein [uncultured Roseovarius sp.]|uniref:hypothetical protein n=1 Tax=uncultured Roseovarius sp. TaxID=293344 RepID=UPI00262F6300|nr:hypothetical protein [uncultured Roseovarius sp.]